MTIENEETKEDNVLFHMPSDPEMFLAAWVTVIDFHQRRQIRNTVQQIWLANIPEELKWILPTSTPWLFTVGWKTQKKWDFEFYFDKETAYSLSEAAKLHATTAFGIQLGTVVEMEIFPKIPAHERDTVPEGEYPPERRIHVFPSTHYSGVDVMGALVKTYDGLQGRLLLRSGLTREVLKSREDLDLWPGDIVIAERGAVTYMASCLNCYVIEVYPDTHHREWMSKWASEGYRMIYGVQDPSRITELILHAMKDLVS